MPIYPDKLQTALDRRMAPVWLVAGDEPLLVDEAVSAIRQAARKRGHEEREVLHRERNAGTDELRTAVASGSLFAARRLIELYCGDAAPDAKLGAFLVDYLAAPSDDVVMIVRCGSLDGRQRNSAWARAVDAAGGFVYAWPLRTGELPRWAENRLREAGLAAERDALTALVDRTEGNLMALAQDIEKLRLLTPAGSRLTVAAIREAVADSAHTETFDWIADIQSGDARDVARGLWRLRAQGETVPGILGALAWSMRQVVAAAREAAGGASPSDVARRSRLPRERQAALQNLLERARLESCLRWQATIADIDAQAKRGHEDLAWEALMSLALSMGGAARHRRRAA